jgi:hypothetical protein
MKFAVSLLTLVASMVGLMTAEAGHPRTTTKAHRAAASPKFQDPFSRTVRLGQVTVIKLRQQPPMTPPEAAKIKRLIASLANIDSPDFGLSSTLSGNAFAPIAGSEHAGALLLTNHQIKSSEALRELVQTGPRALPFLLDALDDSTPTRLTIRHNGMFGVMSFSHEIWGNPANAAEQKALASVSKTLWHATHSPADLARLPTNRTIPCGHRESPTP